MIEKKSLKLRCLHCHLTIKKAELEDGYCPECFEKSGQKVYDFKEVEIKESGTTRYRCEDCRLFIDVY
ncbi:MAG: hypothetical protein HQK79_10825 [Desulfobacterales bacterium]|nr:hypothetical protein [Desulfobacterales bacterium]MBF0396490.1 hypothetical protein [Desulfobacterales bacterium]